jgi:hypothetical protein
MDEHPTEKASALSSYTADSRFWRAGAIAATLFMSAVLAILTVDSLKATWRINRHVALQSYYGHAFGGDVIGATYPAGREGDYGFIQATWML